RLQVALGQILHIGDLEVAPQKVERRRVTFCWEGRNIRPQESGDPALVLTLRLRNTSTDVFFTPTDPVFARKWHEYFGSNKPYAFLEMGPKRFYGGPIQWRPRTTRDASRPVDPREYLKGQEHDNEALKPGGQRTTLFCTDPENPDILQALRGYQGQLIWRVHLR